EQLATVKLSGGVQVEELLINAPHTAITLEKEIKLVGRNLLRIEAKELDNYGYLASKQIDCAAHKVLRNYKSIYGAKSIKVTTASLEDKGTLKTPGTLELDTTNYQSTKEAVLTAGTQFKFIGKKLDNAGTFNLTGSVFVSVGDLSNQ